MTSRTMQKKQDQENKKSMKDSLASAKDKATDAAKKAIKELEDAEDAKIMSKVEKWTTDHTKTFAHKYIAQFEPPPPAAPTAPKETAVAAGK